MKPKRRSKTRKRTPTHKKRLTTRRPTRAEQGAHMAPSPTPPIRISTVKTCEEVEVGDIGGFGSPEELEAHERRCGREATEFCNTCGRNLCGNHYELLHRDHDATGGHGASQGLTGQ